MTTIGVLGQRWRGTVDPWGGIGPWDGGPVLEWCVAADDRWHIPAAEAAVRQHRRTGTPVVETRLRVPGGDAVERVWAVADHGGLVVVEVENDSPAPFAVAFSRGDLLTTRPVADVPIRGIELPEGAVVLPVGHRTSVTVALAMDGRGAGTLPGGIPTATQVERGWTALTERASRLVLPTSAVVEGVVHTRCELALAGPADPDDDPAGFLLGVGELVRMGEQADQWVLDVVPAAEGLARSGDRTWDAWAALGAAARILSVAGEGDRAVADAVAMQRRLTPVPVVAPNADDADGARSVARTEGMLLSASVDGATAAVLPAGYPPGWLGASVEAYRLPAGPRHRVSFAVRWHGERPALLWEVEGPAGLVLTGGGADAAWSTSEARGEALLAPPTPTTTSFS